MRKIIFLIALLCLVTVLIFIKKDKSDSEFPTIVLNGKNIIDIKNDENYIEPGYSANDSKDGDITKQVKIQNNINYDKPGTYEIIYTVINSRNKKFEVKRFVNISLKEEVFYDEKYDKIDNTRREWGTINKKDGTRSLGNATIEDLLKYNAYYIGPDEKIIYLTFDEGANNTYLDKIVEVLNKNNVKATFFLCKNYILSNPSLMKALVSHNHSVGNHTANHYEMPKYADKVNFQKYVNEVRVTEEAFKKVTGRNIDKVYREPKGVWSYRSLELVKNLGYKTYFWSAAYVDFSGTLSKKEAYDSMLSRIHNGAIYLIHPSNKGNYEAMEDFIKKAKELGYKFDLVKNIKY